MTAMERHPKFFVMLKSSLQKSIGSMISFILNIYLYRLFYIIYRYNK